MTPNGFGVTVTVRGAPTAARMEIPRSGDMMAADVPRVNPATPLRDAVAVLLERGWEAGIVETDGFPRGVLGRRQVLAALSERFGGYFSAQELSFAFLRAEAFGSEALRQMWHSF